MAELQLRKIRPLGKLEEISAAAHQIDFFTNTGLSVHYTALQPSLVNNIQHIVYNAVAQVALLHPVLFAVPVVADIETPYWGRLSSIDLKQAVSFIERQDPAKVDSEGRDRELDKLLEEQHNTSFKYGYGTLPVWRLIILEDHGVRHQFTACFIAHHSMSDGSGLQVFHNAFQKALSSPSTSTSLEEARYIIVSNDGDPIPASLEELHPLPLPPTPPEGNTTGVTDWTGSPVEIPCKTRYRSLSLSQSQMQSFTQECRKQKVAPTAALPSLIANLLYTNLPSTAESLTCNIPVSLRSDLPPAAVQGVMGNYIDAFKVKLLRSDLVDSQDSPKSLNLWPHARKIQAATRKYFGNASPSGQAYTNIAFFKLIPDLKAALSGTLGTARGESFEVSNLGKFTQPASGLMWKAGDVMLSRCAYAAGGPLVVCVLSGEENVGVGFTWQDGAVGDDVVEGVIQGLRKYFQDV